jgi:hypothetical protein
MSGYGLSYKSTMCNPKFYASNLLAISIFMIYFLNNCILLRLCLCSQENVFTTTTPHEQAVLFYGFYLRELLFKIGS